MAFSSVCLPIANIALYYSSFSGYRIIQYISNLGIRNEIQEMTNFSCSFSLLKKAGGRHCLPQHSTCVELISF